MSKMPKKQTLEQTTRTRPTVPPAVDVDDAVHGMGDVLDEAAEGIPGDGALDGDESTARPRRFKEVWLVEDRKNARSVWTRVGAAFENADGSWNIRLSAVPVGAGRLNVRDPLPRERPVTA